MGDFGHKKLRLYVSGGPLNRSGSRACDSGTSSQTDPRQQVCPSVVKTHTRYVPSPFSHGRYHNMSPRKRARPNASGGGSGSGSTTSLPATLPSQPSVGQSLATASGELSATKSSSKSKHSMPPASTKPPSNSNEQPEKTKQVSPILPANEASGGLSVQVRKSTSWYGSLGRKASASTQVARETIMGGTLRSGSTADFSRFEPRKAGDTSADSDTQSIHTMPKILETEAQSTSTPQQSQGDARFMTQTGTEAGQLSSDSQSVAQPSQSDTTRAAESNDIPTQDGIQRPVTSSGWFGGWFGTTDAPRTSMTEEGKPKTDTTAEENPAQPEPEQEAPEEGPPAAPETPKSARPTSSWFGWWTTTAQPETAPTNPTDISASDTTVVKKNEDVVMEDVPPPPPPPASVESQPTAGSTWAFWSRDTGSKSAGETTTTPEQGELAVMGEGSEVSPRQSSGIKVKDGPSKSAKEPPLNKDLKESPSKATRSKNNKRERPQSMDLDVSTPPRPGTPVNNTPAPKPETPGSIKASTPNLLLPSFKNTYRLKQNPSIIKQITQLLLRTRQPPVNHVNLVKEPPKIKKAIAIGVHGLFPATFLRPMIGQPTGTSLRFANHCAEAIRRWADSHGCEDCEIEKVALEGEGKIADRVDNLWKLLLNWIDHIRKADLILVACHSQGVPVGLMLVAKLIDLGIITSARIGICAMAGVSLGPFPDYKSGMGMLMGSAAELWQFADPSSEISQRLEHSMKSVLQHGCRVTFIGSIDDQLVPMESAIYSPASHPYIYRAVFVDGRIHAPDFIAHLVGFALKLRNLGISDQGLIRELSVALAGSLYSGEGHSRLYDDEKVYEWVY